MEVARENGSLVIITLGHSPKSNIHNHQNSTLLILDDEDMLASLLTELSSFLAILTPATTFLFRTAQII